jgi:hypothetical protein
VGRYGNDGEAVALAEEAVELDVEDLALRTPGASRRWALFEAAESAARAGSPDRDY